MSWPLITRNGEIVAGIIIACGCCDIALLRRANAWAANAAAGSGIVRVRETEKQYQARMTANIEDLGGR